MGSVPAVRRTLALLIGALALASCGGGGDEESTSSTTQASSTTSSSSSTESSSTTTARDTTVKAAATSPQDSLNAVLVKGDCARAVTPRFVNAAYGSEQACKQAAQAGGTAKSIDVRSVDTNGGTANATVIPDGGPSSGDKLTVTLVKEGDDWKVDSLKSNAPVGP
jgi:hypothetical protein